MNFVDLKFGALFGLGISICYQLLKWMDPSKSILIVSGALCMMALQLFLYWKIRPSPSERRVSLAVAAEGSWSKKQAQTFMKELINCYKDKNYFINDIPVSSLGNEADNDSSDGNDSPVSLNASKRKPKARRKLSENFHNPDTAIHTRPFEPSLSPENEEKALGGRDQSKNQEEAIQNPVSEMKSPDGERESTGLNDPVLKEARSAIMSDRELEEDQNRLLAENSKKTLIKVPKAEFIESLNGVSNHMKFIANFEESYAKKLSEFGKGGIFTSKNLEIFSDDFPIIFETSRLSVEQLILFQQVTQAEFPQNQNGRIIVGEWKIIQSGKKHIAQMLLACCGFIRDDCTKSMGTLIGQYEASHKELRATVEPIKKEYEVVYQNFEKVKGDYEQTKRKLEQAVTAYRKSIKEKASLESQLNFEMKYRKALSNLQTLKAKYVSARAGVEINREQVKIQNKEIKVFLAEWEKRRSDKVVSSLRSLISTILEIQNDSFIVFSDILFAKNLPGSGENSPFALKSMPNGHFVLPKDEEEREIEEILEKNLFSGKVTMRSYVDQLLKAFKVIERKLGYVETKVRHLKDMSLMLRQIVDRENDYVAEIARLSQFYSILKEDPSVFTLMQCFQKTFSNFARTRKEVISKMISLEQKTSGTMRANEKELRAVLGFFSSIGTKLTELGSKMDSDFKKKRDLIKMSKMSMSPGELALESLNPLLLSELNNRKNDLTAAKAKAQQVQMALEEHSGEVRLEVLLSFGSLYQELQKTMNESLTQVDLAIETLRKESNESNRKQSQASQNSESKSVNANDNPMHGFSEKSLKKRKATIVTAHLT